MPLFRDGLKKIQTALELVRDGKPSPFVKVGFFTEEQLALINQQRVEEELEPIEGIVLFNGKHLYRSRCVKDGYSIEEVLEQVESAFSENGTVAHDGSTMIQSAAPRIDRNGVRVRDRVIFECTQRKPSPLLFSVIPLGDGKKSKNN